MDSSDLDPSFNTMVPWTQKSHPPNGTSIGLAVFTQYISITNADRHTDHATFDICSSRPHLVHWLHAIQLNKE